MDPLVPRARTGLILGKFMPPHRGHLHLVDAALRSVDELTILVCSLRREPIPGALRFDWIRELVPGARVVHLTDENPSYPHEHPRFWEMWTESVRRILPHGPDVLFTSESYGDELARRLGARHVAVDIPRSAVPVSGTAIRDEPLKHWDFIPEPVRPYFARRVVVTGSESTGKTTLAARLAAHLGTVWTPEYARGYLDAKPTPLDPSDIEPIARGQRALEEDAARRANRVLIQDTDVLSTCVYAEHYNGTCPPSVRRAMRPPDLYLLLGIDVPWVPDPQRDRGHMREHMHALFRDAVRASGAPYVEITGDWEERFRRAVAAVEGLLQRSG